MSLPFETGKHKRAALKIIDARGIREPQSDRVGMTERTTIDRLIVNSPYEEPQRYWQYNRERRTFTLIEGERRKAGYVIASESSRAFDDPGVFVEIPLVNQIRPRVRAWRRAGYPGVTGITKRLLEHWQNPEEFENRRFFFCQLEAIETVIWLAEAPEADKVGIEVPTDGGEFPPMLQDGDGLGQDHCNGNGDCLAGFEQGNVSAGRAVFEECACNCAGPDGEKPACSTRTIRHIELLRRI